MLAIEDMSMSLIPSSPAELPSHATRFEQFLLSHKKKLMLASFAVVFLLTIILGLLFPPGPTYAPHNLMLQQARQIGQTLWSYAQDHKGKYPPGNSSTEVFQQLIDQNYVTDPTIFYFKMTGKTKPTSHQLKPENVSFDVTDDVLPDDSDSLPVVFSTGYKIGYKIDNLHRVMAYPLANADLAGIAVFLKGNNAMFLHANSDGIPLSYGISLSSPNVEPSFDSKGRTYRQLTPDGPLP